MEEFGVACAFILSLCFVLWMAMASMWWLDTGKLQHQCEETHNVRTCVIQYVPYTQEADE